jgi:CysZ protein
MHDVTQALRRAFRSLLHPQMLALAVWPMLVAIAVWTGPAVASSSAARWLSPRSLALLAQYSAVLLLILAVIPLVLITSLTIAAVFAMPLIVSFVAARDYPQLAKRRGGSFAGSVFNALAAVLIFATLWIVTLPLWLTGILAPLLPVLLSAYLNQRLFRYDALSDHASNEEFRSVVRTNHGKLYLLGLLLALFYYIPLFNLVVPILSGLAFTHFGLATLARLRGTHA